MSETLALLLADGRTPNGAHAHSGALEPAIAAGLRAGDVPALIQARLRTVGLLDASFSAAAARATDASELAELEHEWLARTPAPAVRETGRRLGRSLLRTAGSLGLGSPALSHWARDSAATPRCLVLGAIAAAAGLSPRRAAGLALYDDAATLAAAAPKLLAVDAATTAGWVAAAVPLIDELAARATGPATPDMLPAIATPGLDALAQNHLQAEGRLFAS
jgi:urease accessory protein